MVRNALLDRKENSKKEETQAATPTKRIATPAAPSLKQAEAAITTTITTIKMLKGKLYHCLVAIRQLNKINIY